MSIIKESLVLSLLWFSSASQAATGLNQSFSVNALETSELVSLSPMPAQAANQILAVAGGSLDDAFISPQAEVGRFSADAASFADMLIQPVAIFNLSNPITHYTSNSFSTIRSGGGPSLSTDTHYEFWSMLLVGFLLVLGQVAGIKNTGSDLKLAPLKS